MRRRILAATIGLTAAVIVAFAVPLAFLTFHSVENSALERARYQAEAVAGYIGVDRPTDAGVETYLLHANQGDDVATWVRSPDNTVIGSPPPGLAGETGQGPEIDADGDGRVGDVSLSGIEHLGSGAVTKVDVLTRSGAWTIFAYLTNDQLRDGLAPRWATLAGVSVALLLASVVTGEVLARRLARPLEQTADTAHRLATGDTTARADTTGPREVAEVGLALNTLADRIDEVIAAEREAVADLSHRLRTPLTALRLDVDALRNSEEADRLSEHVTTLERSLTAVIHAARRPTREGRLPSCDASSVVRARVDFWTPLVVDQGRRTTTTIEDNNATARVAPDDLSSAVDGLIENVIAHTPEGTDFSVSVRSDQSGSTSHVVVTVADEGPGLPPGAGARGRSDRGSTGLGLDIARRTAEAAGGHLQLSEQSPHGARVELWLVSTSQPGHSMS